MKNKKKAVRQNWGPETMKSLKIFDEKSRCPRNWKHVRTAVVQLRLRRNGKMLNRALGKKYGEHPEEPTGVSGGPVE